MHLSSHQINCVIIKVHNFTKLIDVETTVICHSLRKFCLTSFIELRVSPIRGKPTLWKTRSYAQLSRRSTRHRLNINSETCLGVLGPLRVYKRVSAIRLRFSSSVPRPFLVDGFIPLPDDPLNFRLLFSRPNPH